MWTDRRPESRPVHVLWGVDIGWSASKRSHRTVFFRVRADSSRAAWRGLSGKAVEWATDMLMATGLGGV